MGYSNIKLATAQKHLRSIQDAWRGLDKLGEVFDAAIAAEESLSQVKRDLRAQIVLYKAAVLKLDRKTTELEDIDKRIESANAKFENDVIEQDRILSRLMAEEADVRARIDTAKKELVGIQGGTG